MQNIYCAYPNKIYLDVKPNLCYYFQVIERVDGNAKQKLFGLLTTSRIKNVVYDVVYD